MRLRNFHPEDSAVICGWVRDEDTFYKWSADMLGSYPAEGDALNRFYTSPLRRGVVPVTAVAEDGRILGHFYMRPSAQGSRIRFCLVIVAPEERGRGLGESMLRRAMEFAQKEYKVKTFTLGVFSDNPAARFCYEKLGFRLTGTRTRFHFPMGEKDSLEMECKTGQIGG